MDQPIQPSIGRKIDRSFYDKDYFVGATKSNYRDYHTLRGSNLIKARGLFIKNFFRPKRTLEIGCAMGFEIRWLRKHGVDAYGVEISSYAVNEAPEDVRRFITIGDVKGFTQRFPHNYFDVIYSWDVLEHIDREDIPHLMGELRRIGQFNYHRVATLEHHLDRDLSHITVEDIDWWRDQFPMIYFAGSSDPDDYTVDPPASKPSEQLIQFYNLYGNRP